MFYVYCGERGFVVMKANIFNILRSSLHDGPGIRTVVYFKGCSLRCRWCHNPEGLSPQSEILYREERCIKCGRCIDICPVHHKVIDDKMVYDREGCIHCGRCAEACPNGALSLCGREMTVNEVFSEAIKDLHYYQKSNGGITLSGGECLLYPDFAKELLKRCREASVSTAIESGLHVPWANIEKVLPFLDICMADMKHGDDDVHRALTGSGNRRILQNLDRLTRVHPYVWIRIPLIPGVNDSDENLIRSAEMINSFGDGIRRVELLKYNPMAGSKYTALGRPAELFAQDTQSEQMMKQKGELLKSRLCSDIEVLC